MDVAKIVLEYTQVLIWPMVALVALFKYGHYLISMLEKSKVKLSLFGIEVEVNIDDLERILTQSVGGQLLPEQWNLLERIAREGSITVKKEGFKMDMSGDLSWIRPVRNAGLIMTLPDGKYIEQATELVLTPLGKLLMEAKLNRQVRIRENVS